jgi:hypothetical protein
MKAILALLLSAAPALAAPADYLKAAAVMIVANAECDMRYRDVEINTSILRGGAQYGLAPAQATRVAIIAAFELRQRLRAVNGMRSFCREVYLVSGEPL